MKYTLNEQEKVFLLKLARQTIRDFLVNKPPKAADYFSENLEYKTGAFVTLHKKGQLRGCIGYVQGFKPLQDAIADLAISAAFNDPRFPSLSSDELNEVDLEISVLTPLEEVHSIDEIKIDRDGLMINKPPYSGLLLPQVATEYHWDVNTFLEQTCHKAGLPSDAWQDEDTQILKFSAIIFGEKEPGITD